MSKAIDQAIAASKRTDAGKSEAQQSEEMRKLVQTRYSPKLTAYLSYLRQHGISYEIAKVANTGQCACVKDSEVFLSGRTSAQ